MRGMNTFFVAAIVVAGQGSSQAQESDSRGVRVNQLKMGVFGDAFGGYSLIGKISTFRNSIGWLSD